MEALGVVVGCDGSGPSEHAMYWAAAEAEARRLPLTLCHVWDWPYHEWPGELVPLELARRPGWRLLDRSMAAVAKRHPGLHVHALLKRGSPGSVLAELSGRSDVVVVGARGAGYFEGALLGSASTVLTAHSRCPAVVVRPGEGKSVVAGVDGSPGSLAALEFAVEEARAHQEPLTVVSAGEERELLLNEALAPWWQRYPELDIRAETTAEPPRQALLSAASGARLLVVGARGLGTLRGLLLGSVSQAMVHHAPCPVAVVHSGGVSG